MPGLIQRNDIDEVRSRVNIADVVGDYVTLKGAGIGSMKGLCPFHDERSPSFHVRPQVGRYHCFGCGEDGDVFSFIQKTDHTTFQEAVERMAARINFTLHYEDGGQASDHGNRARLLAANEAAREFFVEHLTAADADPGRRFLGERGFDPAAAAHFGVGFAPKSFDALRSHLKGRGFTEEELVTAGLLSHGDRNAYDRFRGRLIWPIRDVTGATIGFGARKLLEDDNGPKYLNTPETPIYHKSQVLYGLDLARRAISKDKRVVIVEGYTDVMACHLAGVTTAVATCGTSFGVDHIKVLRPMLGDSRGSDVSAAGEVVFTFDPDEAGQRAASRAFAEEQRFAAQTFVAVAPDGLDPCDLRLNRGDDAVRRLVEGKRPMFEFMIKRVLAGHDLETVEGRVAALRASAPVVAGIRDVSMTQGYVRSLAGWLGLDPPEVQTAVDSARRAAAHAPKAVERLAPSSGPNRQSITSLPEVVVVDERASILRLPDDPSTRLERDALMAILQHPQSAPRELTVQAAFAQMSDGSLSTVRDAIAATLDSLDVQDFVSAVLEQTPAPFAPLVKELAVGPLPEREGSDMVLYCTGVLSSLVERDLLHQKAELLGRMHRTDAKDDPEARRELELKLVQVESARRLLRNE
ncbi:DNA primase [Frondihabitans sp. PAMC 28766]|uniref:DNA primase n=1 Tax=Frondihabitans sp. PAMC 28766 TaxID=1795630 RepID=UPI00078BA7B6|nr:DNA primase [Frondihabitans sp. PAMC 28766]AMM22442.1 DNA primase [Frondihabitans sp. PAMC 28766]